MARAVAGDPSPELRAGRGREHLEIFSVISYSSLRGCAWRGGGRMEARLRCICARAGGPGLTLAGGHDALEWGGSSAARRTCNVAVQSQSPPHLEDLSRVVSFPFVPIHPLYIDPFIAMVLGLAMLAVGPTFGFFLFHHVSLFVFSFEEESAARRCILSVVTADSLRVAKRGRAATRVDVMRYDDAALSGQVVDRDSRRDKSGGFALANAEEEREGEERQTRYMCAPVAGEPRLSGVVFFGFDPGAASAFWAFLFSPIASSGDTCGSGVMWYTKTSAHCECDWGVSAPMDHRKGGGLAGLLRSCRGRSHVPFATDVAMEATSTGVPVRVGSLMHGRGGVDGQMQIQTSRSGGAEAELAVPVHRDVALWLILDTKTLNSTTCTASDRLEGGRSSGCD
ncbi:hypothetical protein K438DRAFT_1778875 [Mycena galopus ATCC 62051]|nr:hypothetical protein K438DRAFT_1778875 [Mycena galopus ATCC 62051]